MREEAREDEALQGDAQGKKERGQQQRQPHIGEADLRVEEARRRRGAQRLLRPDRREERAQEAREAQQAACGGCHDGAGGEELKSKCGEGGSPGDGGAVMCC